MRGRLTVAILAATAALFGCRTETPPKEPVAAREAAPVTDTEAAPAPVAAPSSTIDGYAMNGAVQCLPLDAGRRCLERVEPVKVACDARKGTVARCEDCGVICSVPVN